MTHEQMKITMGGFIKESMRLGMDDVEDFRVRFKKFLTENDVPYDISIELRKSMAAESFLMAFGVSITDFDAKIKDVSER